MCRGGILVQGMCFLSATHSFGGKNLYRELEIGGRHVTLLAIQTYMRKKVCRGTKHGPMTGKLLAIHGFMAKRVCRGREKSWEKERRLVNLGCREADLARGDDRGK